VTGRPIHKLARRTTEFFQNVKLVLVSARARWRSTLLERIRRALVVSRYVWRAFADAAWMATRSPKFRIERTQFAFLAVTVLAGATTLVIGGTLTVGPYPVGGMLYLHYLAYSLAVVALLHGLFFSININRIQRTGRTLNRNTPRYLEYVYAALISVGFAQVYFQPRQFSEFIDYATDTNEQLVKRIRDQATAYLHNQCRNNDPFFPASYCAKLQLIISSKSPYAYLLTEVATDRQFLGHAIDYVTVPGPPGRVELPSPIAKDVNQLLARHEFAAARTPLPSSRLFNWLGLLLLPVGIGLRVLKTSLELFADLK
jgi:hypothetical protein